MLKARLHVFKVVWEKLGFFRPQCVLYWVCENVVSTEYVNRWLTLRRELMSAASDVNAFCQRNSWLSDVWRYCSTWSQSQLAQQLTHAPVSVIEVSYAASVSVILCCQSIIRELCSFASEGKENSFENCWDLKQSALLIWNSRLM